MFERLYPLAKGSAMMDKLKAVKAIMRRVKGTFSFQAFKLSAWTCPGSGALFNSNLRDRR
jgi:hypothetical protein